MEDGINERATVLPAKLQQTMLRTESKTYRFRKDLVHTTRHGQWHCPIVPTCAPMEKSIHGTQVTRDTIPAYRSQPEFTVTYPSAVRVVPIVISPPGCTTLKQQNGTFMQ